MTVFNEMFCLCAVAAGDDIDARRQGDGAPDDGPDAGPTRR